MGPLMADCGAYESYTTCAGKTLRCPILTLRGSNDKITAGGAMQTWGAVAGTRLEHRVLQGVGHMIAKEAPHRVAKIVENRLLPDFTEHLNEYRGFRAAYERLRRLRLEGPGFLAGPLNLIRQGESGHVWRASSVDVLLRVDQGGRNHGPEA